MQLTRHNSPEFILVKSVSEQTITIGENEHHRSLILLPDKLINDWEIKASAELTVDHANQLLEHRPELVILGTGRQLVFPCQEFSYALMRTGVGCEVMDTQAACRTYNILAGDGRHVLGAFII
jgi:uncharacterized protein